MILTGGRLDNSLLFRDYHGGGSRFANLEEGWVRGK
jgi:hypothetical protein